MSTGESRNVATANDRREHPHAAQRSEKDGGWRASARFIQPLTIHGRRDAYSHPVHPYR
jgi:hypothetical protein